MNIEIVNDKLGGNQGHVLFRANSPRETQEMASSRSYISKFPGGGVGNPPPPPPKYYYPSVLETPVTTVCVSLSWLRPYKRVEVVLDVKNYTLLLSSSGFLHTNLDFLHTK